MDAIKSDLSAQKYGYDVVASTSQESLAAIMLQSMTEASVERKWYFFRNNKVNGDSYDICNAKDALKKTHGIDPLDATQCPETMSTNEANYTMLYNAGFSFACDCALGLPTDMTGDMLPQPCVVLSHEQDRIILNVYFEDITIVQARSDSGNKMWKRTSQQRGVPWYVTTKLNIVQADMPDIDDDAYFKRNKTAAKEIKKRAQCGGGSKTSFLHVILDWNHYDVIHVESPGTPVGTTGNLMSALSYSVAQLHGAGLAPLCVLATSGASAGMPLISSCDWQVTPYTGHANISTLDILCMIDGHHLPDRPHPQLDWHWMEPDMEGKVHGLISVNARVISAMMKTQCWEKIAATFCATFKCRVDDDGSVTILSGDSNPAKAYVQLCPEPGVLLRVEYAMQHNASYEKTELWVDYSYTLEITSTSKSFTASQDVKTNIDIIHASTPSRCTFVAHNQDTYDLSVNSEGDLDTSYKRGFVTSPKNEFTPHSSWPLDFRMGAEACVKVFFRDEFKPKIGDKVLETMPMSRMNRFVFPAGQIYSFKDPQISSYSDLLCGITRRPPGALSHGTDECGGHRWSRSEQPPLATLSPKFNLTYSSNLMQNYLPGKAVDLVGSSSKFVALQAKNGNSMVLSVNSAGVLTIVQEQSSLVPQDYGQSEKSKLGWVSSPLTEMGKSVKNFDAAQHGITGAINLAMVLETNGREVLFISLGNSHHDLSWVMKPKWTQLEFDALPVIPPKLHIAGIAFAEASEEYLVVDIDRPGSGAAYIERYHINSSPGPGKKHWQAHDVPGDFLRASYRSCVGRSIGDLVDGIYTSGRQGSHTTGSTQICYQAIKNVYEPKNPPTPRWFFLPDGHKAPPTAMPIAAIWTIGSPSSSSTNNKPEKATELYAVANSNLYRWGTENQRDRARGQLIIQNSPLLSGTHTLLGMAHGEIATIWGLNNSNQLFTISCEVKHTSDPTKWSAPIPAALDIERLSAYVNAVDGSNTIFAFSRHETALDTGDARLVRFTKQVKGAKLWKPQHILFPVLPHEQSKSIMSYTTSLAVKDDQGHGVSDAKLSITTEDRTSVYINGHYHILSKQPTTVTTDPTGQVTVIEATKSISGAVLNVTLVDADAKAVKIKPYEDAYNKIRKLDTKEAIRGATVPRQTVAGGFWETTAHQSLVSSKTTDKTVQDAADIVNQLNKLQKELEMPTESSGGVEQDEQCLILPASHTSASITSMYSIDSILVDIGDLVQTVFEATKKGIKLAIQWAWDGIKNACHVVAKIAGQVYRAVVKTVHDIVAGVVWVFHQVVDFVEDIYEYLKVLFEWSDIQRTKDIFHKVVTLWLDNEVAEIDTGKALFDQCIDKASNAIDKWAGVSHDWNHLDGVEKSTAKQSSKDAQSGQTASSGLLLNHMKNHIGDISLQQSADDPEQEISAYMIEDVISALPTPTADNKLQKLYDDLCSLAHDFHDMSIEKVLKRLVAILADGALLAVKTVVDAVLTVLAKVAKAAVKILDKKIHIPVISDILSALHVPSISFLDLFMWIGAVAYTVTYKLANHNKAPFSKELADSITSKSSWNALTTLFHPTTAMFSTSMSSSSSVDKSSIFHGGHGGAGVAGIAKAILHTIEIDLPANTSRLTSYSSIVAAVTSAVLAGGTEYLAPRCSVKNNDIATLSKFNTVYAVLWGVACGAAGDNMVTPIAKTTGLKFVNGRGAGAIVAAIISIPALAVSGYHFYELAQKPTSSEKTASILGEVSAVTTNISNLAYAVAANSEGHVKKVAVVVVAASDVATAGLQIAEAAIPY